MYLRSNRLEDAVDVGEKALKVFVGVGLADPAAYVRWTLGKIHGRQRKLKTAEEMFRATISEFSALGLRVEGAEAEFDFGVMYVENGKARQGATHLRKALKLAQGESLFECMIWDARLHVGAGSQRMEVAAKAIITEARYGRALSYYFSKDLDHAMEDARLTLKDNPDNIAAMRLLRAVSEPVPDTRPMTVRVVRSAAPDCGETCAEWIAAEGEVDASTPGRFRAVLATLGKRKLPVFMNPTEG